MAVSGGVEGAFAERIVVFGVVVADGLDECGRRRIVETGGELRPRVLGPDGPAESFRLGDGGGDGGVVTRPDADGDFLENDAEPRLFGLQLDLNLCDASTAASSGCGSISGMNTSSSGFSTFGFLRLDLRSAFRG